jgi:hypothetical protein
MFDIGSVRQELGIVPDPWLFVQETQKRFGEKQPLAGEKTERLDHLQKEECRRGQLSVTDLPSYLLDQLPILFRRLILHTLLLYYTTFCAFLLVSSQN